MKENELRIGNYALYFNEKNRDWITLKLTALDILKCYKEPESYKPIPLTEEWLLNAGYNIKSGNIYSNKDSFCELYDCHDIKLGDYNYIVFNTINSIEIKYVHQLQNLYFALTGNELQFNLGNYI